MRGIDFINVLPAKPTQDREDAILAAVQRRSIGTPLWEPVATSYNGHVGTLYVMNDALMVGDEQPMRVSVRATTMQRIADQLGLLLPTTRICDLIWKQGLQSDACLQSPPKYPYAEMSLTKRMPDYDACVTARRAGRQGLVSAGKSWVLTNKLLTQPTHAANYGFFSPGAPYLTASGLRAWQTLGLTHTADHVDYSQVCQLVRPTMIVDGVELNVQDVGMDPELCGLVSSEGVLKVWRLPSVPKDGQPIAPVERLPPTKRLLFTRILYKGCTVGQDVRDWQAALLINNDGIFGKQTDAATRAFQAAQGLQVDGLVNADDVWRMNEVQEQRERTGEAPDDDLIDSFVQARNYTKANRKPGDVTWLVVHSMESGEKPDVAEAVAAWFASKNAPQASAHFNVDADSCVQSVREEDVAWAAPGANRAGLHIEHAGRARQTREQWLDDFSKDMLQKQSAPLAAYLCKKWNIPTEYVDAQGLLAGKRGITTHWDVTKAFKKSTHTDPGPNFVMDLYLDWVRANMSP